MRTDNAKANIAWEWWYDGYDKSDWQNISMPWHSDFNDVAREVIEILQSDDSDYETPLTILVKKGGVTKQFRGWSEPSREYRVREMLFLVNDKSDQRNAGG